MINPINIKIFFGLFLLLWLIYNRLFRVREDRSIYTQWELFSLLGYFFLFTGACLLLIINIFILYKFLSNKQKKEENRFLIKIKLLWHSPQNPLNYLKDSLLSLDIYIKNNVPKYDDHKTYIDFIIEKISKVIIKYQQISTFIIFLVISFSQTIVFTSLFLDIFFLGKLHYFYRMLWVLIFPLIISYIIYSIKTFAEVNIASLDDILEFNIVSADEFYKDQINAQYYTVDINQWYIISYMDSVTEYICHNSLKEHFSPNSTKARRLFLLNNCLDALKLFFTIRSYINSYEYTRLAYFTYFNIFRYLIYSICWLKVIILNLLSLWH